jgi:hypothetical protein
MPTVTVRQPNTIKVRVEGQKSRVQSINYGSKTLRSSPDLNLTGANTGDVIVYDSQTNGFSVKPIGQSTPVTGALIPTQSRAFDLGSRTRKFRSLYLSGNTIDLDGVQIKSDGNTGSISFAAAPTEQVPNPIAILVTPSGGFAPVQTVAGEIPPSTNIQSIVANTTTFVQFTGGDAGFF